MYINDVIRFVEKHYPSEYDRRDMYLWCDELSAQLVTEDRMTFKEVVLPVYKGTVLLPEYVSIEYVSKVFAGDRELHKQDLRCFNKHKQCMLSLPSDKAPACVTVVYQAPYEPIRLIKYIGNIVVDKSKNTVTVDVCEFIKGDHIVITIGDKDISAMIMDIEPMNGGASDNKQDYLKYVLTLNVGALSDISATTVSDGTIQRIVTDKTVCSAPFDAMYTDYVLAKICYYQHDNSGCNQHKAMFNSRLADYRKWLVDKLPYDNGEFINYWTERRS